ncbi:MAG TPA: hypothetical protein VJJ70_05145 [Anaerolineales bacterium]|nr:hypothetical protein [Anaerolineales bacterium]
MNRSQYFHTHRERSMKKGCLVLFAAVGVLLAGCSGEVEPPTCDVYVSGNRINVVVTLPAEGMDYHDTHDLTPSGFSGTPSEVTIDSDGSSVEYSQTGNTYVISYTVTYRDGDIAGYDISIRGSVYGDVEHTCTKE